MLLPNSAKLAFAKPKVQEIIGALQSNQQLVVEGDQSHTDLKDHLHFDDPDDRFLPRQKGKLGYPRRFSVTKATGLTVATAAMPSLHGELTVNNVQGALVINFRGNRLL